MEDHGFEVHRADEDIEIGETVYPEGSYVVRMDQPFSRGADMLLDKQYYNPDDPRPYDDTGWTIGPLFNAKTVRIEDTAILDADMTLVPTVTVDGGVEGRGGTYLVNYNADNTLAQFRFSHDDLVIHAARADFTEDDREFNAGTFVIREEDNPRGSICPRSSTRRVPSTGSPPIARVATSDVPLHEVSHPPRRGDAHLDAHPGRRVAPDRTRRVRDSVRLHLGARRARQRADSSTPGT